ncbi:MAG: FeoB-associated Cys-rich membrane protein [Eubacterium sp.]
MGTVLVCAVLVLIVGAIVYKMVKDKKAESRRAVVVTAANVTDVINT